MAGALDKQLWEERLASRESAVTATVSIQKISQRLHAFMTCVAEGDPEKMKSAYNGILKDVTMMDLEMRKAEAIFRQLPREREEYESHKKQIDKQKAEAVEDIRRLKQELMKAQQVRRQLEEYESLARQVNEFPAEAHSAAEVAKLDEEIAKLEEEKRKLGQDLEFRQRQISFILQAVADLKTDMDNDLAIDRAVTAFKASSTGDEDTQAEQTQAGEGEGDNDTLGPDVTDMQVD